MSAALALEGGFADPAFDAQVNFRALMDALANPGTARPLKLVSPPPGLSPELAAVALTLCDHDTTLWLSPALAQDDAIVGWLRFQTAAPLATDTGNAAIALLSAGTALQLEHFALGSAEYPDRSTTLVVGLEGLDGGAGLTLMGSGIKHSRSIAPRGLPDDFVAQWTGNRALFPRGIDLLLVAQGQVIGLPRSARIAMEG